MDTTTENGGSFAVDLNDNEEESGAGEAAGKAGHRAALKGRSLALLAGVSGGQEAGKARTSVTSNGGGVNTAASVQPPPHNTDFILDLVAAEGCLADSCVVSGDLNGFTESGGQEGGGEGLPLTGTTAASCPAGLRELVSAEADGQVQEDPEGETRDCGSCIRTPLPPDRLPCTAAGDVNMPNGGVDSPAHSSPDGDTTYWKQTQVQDQRLSLSDVDCEQVKLANGGLHFAKSETHPDNLSFHWGAAEEKRPGWGHCLGSGPLGSLCPGQDAPAVAGRPHPPAPGSSANLPHSCPSTLSDSPPQSEPITGEDEEDFSDLCFPVRPHSLRTNPNHAMSLSCDATPLSPDEDGGYYLEDGGYEEDLRNVLEAGRRQSAPDKLPDLTGSDGKMLPKRFGLADFFTRSLFSRKSKEPKAASHNASGWRLFGKTAATEGEETSTNTQEEELDLSLCPQRPPVAARRKNLEFEPLSTTALILEDRPSNLPAKSMEETQRHKLEYDEMVAGAKKREMKDAQKKKRQMKERHRHEDSISSAMVIWNTEILPHWDTVKGTRRVRELWWQGLPPSVRGRVWSLAIGNELNITPELYEIFLSRAKEKWRSYSETSSVNDSESDGGASLADRESSLDLIKLDISRTFPSLFIFQKGGPYHDLLHSVLGAYTCYRPDIGYVQGMSFIAAVLILNLEEAEAFITFANLLNKPCQMAFFRVDHELMLKYFSAFEIFFEENLPRLFGHFQSNSLTPDLYLIDWIFTLYSKSLPLDVACRVWDVFCRDGEESLFRTGLGILRLYEDILLQMDFIHIAQFLSRLPEDLQPQTLFNAMATTHMISRTRRWAQVFSALMKDGNKEVEKNSSPALRS